LEIVENSHNELSDIPGRVELPEKTARKYSVQPGDILFNRTSETREEVGLASIYVGEEPVIFGGFVIRARMKSEVLDQRFAGYALRAPGVRKQIASSGQGAIRANISQKELSKVEIPVPSPKEQRAIADALSDVDALIDRLDALIAKKRNVKTATMQRLLTGQQRLPGFSTPWTTKRLGEIGDFAKGKGIPKKDTVQSGIPCVRYAELYTHHRDIIRDFASFIPPSIAESARPLMKGDVVFAGSGETKEEIGMCAAYLGDEEAYAGGDIVIFSPNVCDPRFLGYALNAPYAAEQKSRMAQGDAIVHLYARHLSKLKISLPPEDEQRAIARVLADMDAEMAALEKRREKTKAVKTGMMQELLTGKTRLQERAAVAS
jgi:type I restriction enzyme S subunit